ncbi:hypothetical protein VYU27_002542 [Nannochloropsis oceanica]
MQRPPSPPAPSALSSVRLPAFNKERLRQMQQQKQDQHDQQNGSDGMREPTVQNNLLGAHKSLVDEMERHKQALTFICADQPTPAIASPAYIRRQPSDGTGFSYPSTMNFRSASLLPALEDDDSHAIYHEQLEQKHPQRRPRLQYPGSDWQGKEGCREERAEEDEEEEVGQQFKGLDVTCTTFASNFPGEVVREEPAQGIFLEDSIPVTELLESEKFEKSIFVKAALQLLLDKAGGGGSSNSCISSDAANGIGGIGSSSNSINTTAPTRTTGRVNISLSVAVSPDDVSLPTSFSVPPPFTCSTSILKSGPLKKANHHAMGVIWKNKLVEVHQGLFVYENDDSMMGRRRKTLPLHASICSCKPVASKKNNVFELALKKGARRLWMCTSEEERNEWVQAINGATVVLPPGGRMEGQAIDPSSPYAGDMVKYRDLRASVEGAEDRESYQRAMSVLLEKKELCVPFPWIRGQIFPSSPLSSSSSTASLFSPFYLKYVRRRPNHPNNPNHHNLHSPSVPVHHQHQHPFANGGGGSSSSSALNQLWKDMMRDKVCINGQTIHGESGPEAILGALARTLSKLAQKSKEFEQEEASSIPSPSLGGLSLGAAAADGGIGSSHHIRAHKSHHTQYHHQHQLSSSVPAGLLRPLSSSFSSSSSSASSAPHSPLSALNEVQVVSHTMDILLACNRTQSGGDTYYCIEYLLRNPELVVVCPYSSHAEPLDISLELVEEESVISVVSSSPSLHSPLVNSPEQQEDENRDRGGGGHRYSLGLRGSRARGPGSTSSSPQRWYRADSLPAQLLQSGPTEAAASSPVSPCPPKQQQIPQPPTEAASSPPNFSWTLPLSAPPGGGRGRQLQQAGGAIYDIGSPGRSSVSSTTDGGSSPLSEVEQIPPAAATASAASFSRTSAAPVPAESEGQPTIHTSSLRRPVILVKIQANTSYKVCPLDPQDGDDNDIWGLISARFEQHFIVSGAGLAKSDELIRLKTITVSKGSGSDSSHSAENGSDDDQSNRPLSHSTGQVQHQGGGSMLSTTPRPSSGGKGREQQPRPQSKLQQQRQTTEGDTSSPDGAT